MSHLGFDSDANLMSVRGFAEAYSKNGKGRNCKPLMISSKNSQFSSRCSARSFTLQNYNYPGYIEKFLLSVDRENLYFPDFGKGKHKQPEVRAYG